MGKSEFKDYAISQLSTEIAFNRRNQGVSAHCGSMRDTPPKFEFTTTTLPRKYGLLGKPVFRYGTIIVRHFRADDVELFFCVASLLHSYLQFISKHSHNNSNCFYGALWFGLYCWTNDNRRRNSTNLVGTSLTSLACPVVSLG